MRPKDLHVRGWAIAVPMKGRIRHSWGVILGEECKEEMREGRGKTVRAASNETER